MALAPAGAAERWHEGYREFAVHLRGLYQRCQAAYHAFDDLPRLVDQLRILSVNAELASARAGDHGRAVRVLTHFATESVGRLMAIVPEMVALKRRTYAHAGLILRAALDVSKIEAAGGLIAGRPGAEEALAVLDAVWRKRLDALARAVAELSRAHAGLMAVVRAVREATLQTEMIAANIAIEATAAGPFEADLTAIADTLHERVEALRTMIDGANRGLREAADTNLALAAFGALARTRPRPGLTQ